MSNQAKFLQDAEKVAFDRDHRQRINNNMAKYDRAVEQGKQQYADLEAARRRAKNLKHKAIESLDSYLLEFEKNFQRNGGKLLWARNEKEAIDQILNIASSANAKKVVKSKSMATEEIHLNEHLEKAGIETLETDLGEYIVQLAGEKPYHIVTPAMHKSKEDVAKLFHEKLGTGPDATPEQLTGAARKVLREQYLQADIGITGANFILPDTGSIAITENEGNARLATSFPDIHIAIVGIEKILPKAADLGHFWPLLATHGTGQQLTVYNSILSGPKHDSDVDGPKEMYVLLLDNGRTDIIADPQYRESMYCIRCGACLNACPVYKNIGGHSYNTAYSGPIGSVISPHMHGMEEFKHLSYASSLCGKCTEVCPVNINLHNMLVHNRKSAVERGHYEGKEKRGWKWWARGMKSRKLMNMAPVGMKSFVMKTLFKDSWGKRRAMPEFPKKSFNEQWREKDGK